MKEATTESLILKDLSAFISLSSDKVQLEGLVVSKEFHNLEAHS